MSHHFLAAEVGKFHPYLKTRKSWKISINCCEISLYIEGFLELFGIFLFYFMSVVIIKNVISLFECKWFMSKQFFPSETPHSVRKQRNPCGQ